jgi:hypothetical protein
MGALIISSPIILNIIKNALSSYLRVYKPIPDAQILIVEGWIFKNLIPYVSKEFQNGRYKYILISGESDTIDSNGGRPTELSSDSERVTRVLVSTGIDPAKIRDVEIHQIHNHNTLAMALAAKEWLDKNDPAVTRVNVCTAGTHGQKTWIAYKRALGKTFSVGILSFPRKKIPVYMWWKEGGGLRWLLWRWGGAIYALFWPLSMVDYQ